MAQQKADFPLLESKPGQWVHIVGFGSGELLTSKLRQLGLTAGTRVRVMRRAPLGGPVLIEVDGRSVALGRGIAAKIRVEDD